MVEASGVADPGQIVVLGDLPGYRKDAAVVVADAETVRARAADETTGYLVRAQLRAADLLVLNKTDLVDSEQLATTHAWLRDVAGPSTAIVEASFGQVPIDVVLGAQTFARPERERHDHDHDHTAHAHEDHHHPSFETWSWQGEAAIDGAGLVEAIKELPDGIVRAKGLLTCARIPPAATCCRSSDGASAWCPTVRGAMTRPHRSSSSSAWPDPSTSRGWRRCSSA